MKLLIEHDEDALHPRKEFDNFGVMACWHRRYQLGDVQPKEEPKDWLPANVPKGSVMLPLFLFDHSGITMKTSSSSFSAADPDGWDWGRVGIIFATPEAIRENFLVKRITKKTIELATSLLQSEVKTYDDYLNNQVWGYTFTNDKEEEDSCWGFYGSTLEETGLVDSVPEEARPLVEAAWDAR